MRVTGKCKAGTTERQEVTLLHIGPNKAHESWWDGLVLSCVLSLVTGATGARSAIRSSAA
jgi:hypothetical protein